MPEKFGEATDGELFERMAKHDDEAKEAWAEFYQRYFKDFRRLVCRIRGLTLTGVDDLVQETMFQAYKAAHTYKAVDATDAGALRLRTLAWLGRIARNIYNSAWRSKKDVTVNDFAKQDGDGNLLPSEKDRVFRLGKISREIREAEEKVAGYEEKTGRVSSKKQLLHNALEALTERERDILLAYYEHYERGQMQQRMPQQVIDEICKRYGINSTYLRKLRERADKKIREHVKTHQSIES